MPSSPYPEQQSSQLVVRQSKRRGIALSCAECRRLKLKCSREFPCGNCVKKGCAAICPEGCLTTGKGNRFVLANTESLHEKITALSNRVRQLEDGLASAHSLNSTVPHPLLAEDLLQIKRPLERERVEVPQIQEPPESGDAIDSLGSLSISTDGKSSFYGQTANAWYLLQNEGASDDDGDPQTSSEVMGPSDPAWYAFSFPFAEPIPQTALALRDTIISELPDPPSARRLVDLYYQHAAWMYEPITERDFFETIFRVLYPTSTPDVYVVSSPSPLHHRSASPEAGASPAPSDSHNQVVSSQNLSVLCTILAIGVLLDLDRPAHDPLAMKYYHLGRLALSIESVMEEQSIAAVQALLLMCHFMFLSEMGGPRWVIMGMVVKLAQSIGLHRDSGKWKLDQEQSQKRRELFYELLTYDSWQSLTFGRPPSLSSAHIDCELPRELVKGEHGNIDMSFAAWKHRFSAQCLNVVHDQAFGTRAPNYNVIQNLDRKVKEWYVPPNLQVPGFGGKALASGEVERPSVQLTMQRYITFAIKEMTLFYMHRGFFAQALEDCPTDPMGSKYSPSVLAAYGSATSFVGLVESLFKQHPQLTERMWFLFTHVFSCSIVLGSIAAKSQMGLARSALSHLESAYNLFSKVSDKARAGKILPILAKLRERAHQSLNEKSGGHLASSGDLTSRTIKTDPDRLSSALGGGTRLVSRRASGSPSVSAPSPPSQPSSPPSSGFLSPDDRLFASPSLSGSALSMGLNTGFGSPSNATSISGRASGRGESPGWQNYTHIQNVNVNINVPDNYYPTPSTSGTQQPQPQDPVIYQVPVAFPPVQQQHHQHQLQHQLQHQYQHQHQQPQLQQPQQQQPQQQQHQHQQPQLQQHQHQQPQPQQHQHQQPQPQQHQQPQPQPQQHQHQQPQPQHQQQQQQQQLQQQHQQQQQQQPQQYHHQHMQPQMQHSQPQMQHPHPQMQHAQPQIQHAQPQMQHPQQQIPQIQHPQQQIQHAQQVAQQHHPNDMLVDLGNDAYFTGGGYGGVTYGTGGYNMMGQPADLGNVPDFQESWTTLVASQYK